MPLLEVERLSKGFGGVRAVHDVGFVLEEGELLGIMGPNGSGKTTLFNLIAGALAPDAGRIRLAGRDIAGRPAHEVCAAGVARTFQLVRPFAGLTALENVLVGRLYGRARTTRSEAATAMELVRDLVAGGMTVLMVEHIVWALMDLARRIVVLSAGEKIADGPPAAVAADPNVVDVYLGGDVGRRARA